MSCQWTVPTQSRCGEGVAARPRWPGARRGLPCPVPACGSRDSPAEAGRVPIAGRSLGGVGLDRGLRGGGGEGGGVRGEPGATRTILLFHIISARPSNSLLWYVPSLRYMEIGS
jgi:hypothetical protein